jgi:hypothetical protein
MQARLEARTWGRALITVFLVVTVVALVFWNMPDSRLRYRVLKVLQPYVFATGLDQNWSVFAPDPRRQVLDLNARIEYADGSAEIWKLPSGGALIGTYWDYRWRKWLEYVSSDAHQDLWKPAAIWIARYEADRSRRPVQVTLIRRWYEINPPGVKSKESKVWNEFEYYTLAITPAILRGQA